MKQNGGISIDKYTELLNQWKVLVNSAETNADYQKVQEMKIELDNFLRYKPSENAPPQGSIQLSSGIRPSNYYSTNKEGIPNPEYSLYNFNINQKSANYDIIFKELSNTYKNKFDRTKLSTLASIGASILSIKKMPNGEPKKILLNALKAKINEKEKSLSIYPKFKEYVDELSRISPKSIN